jgi:hypothetical protein
MTTKTTRGWWITRTNQETGTFARIERHATKAAATTAARMLAGQNPAEWYEVRQETADGGVVFSARVEAIRDAPILIKLTAEESRLLRAAARRAGLGLGPWLRSLGMREAGGDEQR